MNTTAVTRIFLILLIILSPISLCTITTTGDTSTYNGTDDPWSIATLIISETDDGALTVNSASGITFSSAVYVARTAGKTGSITITGSGSTLSASGYYDMYIGEAGTGEVTVTDSAAVDCQDTYIGNAANSIGTINVSNGATFKSVYYCVR